MVSESTSSGFRGAYADTYPTTATATIPLKIHSPGRQAFSEKEIILGAGLILLLLMCVSPTWNALALLRSENYVMWYGEGVPSALIAALVGLIILYLSTVAAFFAYARSTARTSQAVWTIATVFITLLGLIEILASFPLTSSSVTAYDNLMNRCNISQQTYRLFEYSQVLQNIRRQPSCINEISIETCPGYQEAAPYTDLLRALEHNFQCSGFCYIAPAAAATATTAAPAAAAGEGSEASNATALVAAASGHGSEAGTAEALSLLQTDAYLMRRTDTAHIAHTVSREISPHRSPASLERLRAASMQAPELEMPSMSVVGSPTYPPTLFSQANYQASCSGMAARDMRNLPGAFGAQLFQQGSYLVLIAVFTGVLKLTSTCVGKSQD